MTEDTAGNVFSDLRLRQMEEEFPRMSRTYNIEPRSQEPGFTLKLYEDGEEMGGGVFVIDENTSENEAFNDALAQAEAWTAAGDQNAAAPRLA